MPNDPCPSESRLREYLLGEGDPDDLEEISKHLEQCPDCERVVENAEAEVDTLLLRLRAAFPESSTIEQTPDVSPGEETVTVAGPNSVDQTIDQTAQETNASIIDQRRDDHITRGTAAFVPNASSQPAIATEVPGPDDATLTHAGTDHDAITAQEPAFPNPTVARVPTREGIGTVIAGRYTLVEVIGEGGMGSVYLAEQTRPVKRQVALKLIKSGMDSRGVLARFDAERQALAMMDHPNIARIYDGGLTPVGQPFFVMELVKGVPLTEFCDKQRLSITARLELFVAVCQAVQHAHQKGIIHRDLKPGNVLVTDVDGRPTPMVIDFGVAKATEVSLSDMSFSDTGAIVGTPTYMSPEQADPSSMDIDTRTDVYALGVMLYELLVGSPPLDARDFKRGAVLEMPRMVREVDPPRPSTKLSTAEALPNIAANRSIEPARLAKLFQGELDWVVMKALEKDRNRRYDTANGFAHDIQRYLADEVVEARPPSRGYRLKKFVKRNKIQAIAASLVFFALLAGMSGMTWGLIREAQRVEERDYQLGIGNFLLARAAYENRDLAGAIHRLSKEPEGQRGWEWQYLKRQTCGSMFTLYTGEVTSVSFSPDGTRIVTGSHDNTAKVWDARTGSPILDLKGHARPVSSVGFSPDGTRIVTGSEDQTAKVWDARTGSSLLDLKGHTGPVRSVRFSPDGTRIVTGSHDQTTKVWDARSDSPLIDLMGHTGTVLSVSFSPDGTRIVTGSDDQTAKVWDARTGTLLLNLMGHTGPVWSVSFSPDGTRIVTASSDGTEKIWDARTGEELKGEPIPQNLRPGEFSPDGKLFAYRTGDRVELIPMTIDAEEREYRLFHTRPDERRYAEEYEAARQSKDDFAARFYLDRLIELFKALNKSDAVKKWQAEWAKYPEASSTSSIPK